MPVRFRITLQFSIIAFFILGIVCIVVYLFSLSSRRNYIGTRLTNLTITTARFLSRAETFNPRLIQKIDSLTTIAFTRKTVQAYDQNDRKIYSFNDDDADTLIVSKELLADVRTSENRYAFLDTRDIVYNHYKDGNTDLVVVAAGYDIYGWQSLRKLLVILLISFTIGLVIAIISGYVFSGKLLRPLKLIADEVNEISAHDLNRRFKVNNTRDEWNYLSSTLNELLDRLQQSFELQRRFVANASHELSTPLAAISSQLDVVLQKDREAADYKRVMQSVHEDIRHMGKLTHTLLEMAKASKTRGGIDIKLFRVDELLFQVVSNISKLDSSYSVSLEFDNLPEDEERITVLGNEELLFTSIKNVVLNACKYSADHKAEILLHVNGDAIYIFISNTGNPIPSSEFENIFQPFYRVEQHRSTGGFGLGLSLARRIVQLHEGKISVTSNEQKTCFTIQLAAAKTLKKV